MTSELSTKRAAAILLTALLLMSTLVVIPSVNVAAASEANTISIHVIDSIRLEIVPPAYPSGATVKLTEVHTGSVVTASRSGTLYVASNVPSGWYVIDVTASGFFNYNDPIGFRFDGTAPVDQEVMLTKQGSLEYTYTVTVQDSGANPITGATVSFFSRASNQTISTNTTTSSGVATVKIYGGAPVDLVVSKAGYAMSVTSYASIGSSAAVTVSLNNAIVVGGTVRNADGALASDVVGYMYSANTALPWEQRVLKWTGSAYPTFYAFAGNWILVIDGSDIDPWATAVTLPGVVTFPSKFNAQNKSQEDVSLTFTDWNTLAIHTDATWRMDKTYAGMDYSDIGSLKAQIDLALGDANGQMTSAEWTAFTTLVSTHGPNYVTTSNLLHVNSTQYVSNAGSASTSFDATTLPQAVSVPMTFGFHSDFSYTTQTALTNALSYYRAEVKVPYDGASLNKTFEIALVANYERLQIAAQPSYVYVSGYTTVTVDPLSGMTGTATLYLDIKKSGDPIAKGAIVEGATAYKRANATGVLINYVVKMATNITFTASGSSDPNNSNPLTYDWDFGDGSAPVTTTNLTTVHNYAVAFDNRTVTLTVTDVTSRTDVITFKVKIDGKDPRAAISVKNTDGDVLTGVIKVAQGDWLKFTPSTSADDLVATSDGKGNMKLQVWTFKNIDANVSETGNTSNVLVDSINTTVWHKFVNAGQTDVTLNVTDVVGHWKTATVSIFVNDTKAPTVSSIKLLNGTWGTTLLEGKPVYFDASKTTSDNLDNISDLQFHWYFGDKTANVSGTGAASANVTHNYTTYGQYKIYLNVTDTSNNTYSYTQTVYIGMGPRPNIQPDEITFDPTTFEEGVNGEIRVEFTNKGSTVAKNISIEVWYYSTTENQKKVGYINMSAGAVKNATTNATIYELAVGGTAYGVITWAPEARGNYTIKVVTNATEQPSTNSLTKQVGVKEAAWKPIALAGGIIGIFVVAILLLLARRRVSSMGGMMKRPKKEKAEKMEKEEKEQ